MTPAFDKVQALLKKLPGLGYRSAERLALHLLVEKPGELGPLMEALEAAAAAIHPCPQCGNLCEGDRCGVCADERRNAGQLCFVEQVPDLAAMERSGAYRGRYHVLHGKLSPLHGVGPEALNLANLSARLNNEPVEEVILALSNDIEGEATCHYLQETFFKERNLTISRIGFGLPSGSGLLFADATTLKSALDGRRRY